MVTINTRVGSKRGGDDMRPWYWGDLAYCSVLEALLCIGLFGGASGLLLVLMRILCPGDFLFARLFFLVFMDAIIIHGSLTLQF